MTTEMKASLREASGKGSSRRLRKNDLLPGVIYGANEDAVKVELVHHTLFNQLENNPSLLNEVISLDVSGKKQDVVIKDLQRHPHRPILMHVDFLRVTKDSMLRKTVPFKFIGKETSSAVKLGAIMTFFQRSVEIRCLAKDLPSEIEVDVSTMAAMTNIRLSDIKLPAGVQITALLHGNSDYNQAVVGVGKARA